MSAAALRSSAAIPRAARLVAPGPRIASAEAIRPSGVAAWLETERTRTTPRDARAHAQAAAAHDRAALHARTATAARSHQRQAAAHRAALDALDHITRAAAPDATDALGRVLARQALAAAERTARGLRDARHRADHDTPPTAARLTCRTLTNAPGAPNPAGPARAA